MAELSTQLFFICLVAGLLLMGAELFLPGGIIGTVGCLCLLAAVVLGFKAFPAQGPYIAVSIILLAVGAIVVWITVFPKTRFGRSISVQENLSSSKATEEGLKDLVGKSGIAVSALRPGGYAEIEGRRIDVITQGEMLANGNPVTVVEVEGNRVVVEKSETLST